MLAMPVDEVRCIYFEGAGCYGRNGHEDAAADAALIARRSAGRCGCNGRAPTSAAGTPRARRPCSIYRRHGREATVTAWESEFFSRSGPM